MNKLHNRLERLENKNGMKIDEIIVVFVEVDEKGIVINAPEHPELIGKSDAELSLLFPAGINFINKAPASRDA
ncbi:MAG TPA: hypothetical protein PKE62_11225 [Anaerolineales bacterium]|mgnify:CR=1 FL=1|nr:hypothetical protein [Anaerolineales bacterium]